MFDIDTQLRKPSLWGRTPLQILLPNPESQMKAPHFQNDVRESDWASLNTMHKTLDHTWIPERQMHKYTNPTLDI